MSALVERIRQPLLARPGLIEGATTVKRRIMLVSVIMALAVTGVYVVARGDGTAPFNHAQLQDLAGLPDPPAQFGVGANGRLNQLSPEEAQQLEEIRRLIQNFPVPDAFAKLKPGSGKPPFSGKKRYRGGG